MHSGELMWGAMYCVIYKKSGIPLKNEVFNNNIFKAGESRITVYQRYQRRKPLSLYQLSDQVGLESIITSTFSSLFLDILHTHNHYGSRH